MPLVRIRGKIHPVFQSDIPVGKMPVTRDSLQFNGVPQKRRGALKRGEYVPIADLLFDSKKPLSTEEKVAIRSQYVTAFTGEGAHMVPYVHENIQSLTTLDQGVEGACTLACLLNMMHISGKDQLAKKSWNKIRRKTYWGKIYRNILRGDLREKGSICDHQEMLQVGYEQNVPLIQNVLADPYFRYVPIRSHERMENLLNPEVVTDPDDWLGQIGDCIENLVRRGIPVGIAQNGHARVIVAFNKTHVLMMDSWGDRWSEQKSLGLVKDTFAAGFSTLPKYVMYGAVRDLIYFDHAGSKQADQPAPATPSDENTAESKQSEPKKPKKPKKAKEPKKPKKPKQKPKEPRRSSRIKNKTRLFQRLRL